MSRDLGRLDATDIKEADQKLQKIFNYLETDKNDLAKTNLAQLLTTSNYFLREYFGKKLASYKNTEKMELLILHLIGHKTYGVRASILFYYYYKNLSSPEKIVNILDMSWNDTPWETEHILQELWQKHPDLMKEKMLQWADSIHEKQRTFAYHGIENVASSDPFFITKMIEKNLDDPLIEIQKKISNVLTHTARIRPAECYSFVREWLTKPTEVRQRTIFIAMKKLITLAYLNNVKNKSDDFYLLTIQSINDWKTDPDRSVSNMGERLVTFSKNPNFNDQDN